MSVLVKWCGTLTAYADGVVLRFGGRLALIGYCVGGWTVAEYSWVSGCLCTVSACGLTEPL